VLLAATEREAQAARAARGLHRQFRVAR